MNKIICHNKDALKPTEFLIVVTTTISTSTTTYCWVAEAAGVAAAAVCVLGEEDKRLRHCFSVHNKHFEK